MSATITPSPVIVRRLPVPAVSCHQNARKRPDSASCDDSIGEAMNLPSTVNEWLELHPDGFWQLGGVLRPVAGIVTGLAEREGLDYAEAVQSLIADHFVLRYESYLAKYNPARGLSFLEFCKIRFCYLVRQGAAHRSAHLRTQKAKATTPGALPSVDVADKALSVVECQTCKAIALEDRQGDLQTLATICEKLKELDSVASFVLWEHTAKGRTYYEIGQYLGKSDKSVKQIHIGALATMRRMLGVKVA